MNVDPVIVDIETAPIDGCEAWLDPVEPARNLKDPAKIADDVAKRERDRLEKLGLDWNCSRIVALATWSQDKGETVVCCETEADEARALAEFWPYIVHRRLIGFNIKNFDGPFLTTRSRLLSVPHPSLDWGRYAKNEVHDLYLALTFNDIPCTWAMRRTLTAFCRRYQLPEEPDPYTGQDVQRLVVEGNWAAIALHALADVRRCRHLAARLGVIPAPKPAPVDLVV